MRHFTSHIVLLIALLGFSSVISASPVFYHNLDYPLGFIARFPSEENNHIVSIESGELPRFKRDFENRPKVTGFNYKNHTLTITGQYYQKGSYVYDYTPLTVDASDFLAYRRQVLLGQNLSELRAKALTKEQKQKEGGLLSVNIPLKSKAIESLFGEGGAGLKVSGYHQISFSGSSQWNDQASTATYRQSKFPSLNMEQVSRFDINGTIGSKISVAVSQDSKTDIPLANRIILRYKGEEDDIIKSIEAGNTTLSLPNTQFVGYSSRIQGLFGVKTQAQVGNLTLTAIASQEKGTTERSSITAGAASSKKYLRDYQYAQGKIFDLGGPGDFQKGDVIQTIEVFTSSPDSISIGREANFYVHPDDTLRDSAESVSAYATEYKGSYFVDEGNYSTDSTQHWILFDNSYAGNFNNDIGVRMTIRRANGTIDSIGNTSSEPYKFKLIRRHQPDSSQVTWKYMWRNVYDLGDRNIGEGLQINVFKGSEGTQGLLENLDNQNGRPYIRILGLDKFDQEGKAGPDGLVDIRRAGLIDMGRGLLIFPDRKPFAPDSNALDTTVLSPIVPEIYAYENSSYIPSKYYIEISNQSRSAEISLGRANILEGSERVTLNGRQLVRGQDYNIQYDFGQVTFLTQDAMDPNASINIEYEYSPFIMAEKKTLFGVRGEYQFSDDFKVGSTFLYKSDKATERRPKIGQETARTVVWDADTRFKLRPNFLSKAANILPFYSTEEGSSLEISAEVARSYPNPNVDGVAYLDDFEGGRDPYSLGILRGNWTLSSKPIGLTDRNVRAKMIWYNPYKEVSTETIWDLQTKPGDQGTQTLWLEFNPLLIDRRSNDALLQRIDTVNISRDSTWGGIMRYLPAGAANQQRSQLLEMRLQGDKGIIHIDLGMISEDVNGNNTLDTENKISSSGLRKNFLDPGEDVGLDGLNDDQEKDSTGLSSPDPNGDDWYYNDGLHPNNDYSHINGTEGNVDKDPDRLGRPDTEGLYYPNTLSETNNDYFSYRIDLSDTVFYVPESKNDYGWRTFRIPIKDSSAIDTTVGAPNWLRISYARIWLESPVGDTVKFASLDLIQSNWEDTLLKTSDSALSTSKFSVAVINTQENTDYVPPPGVTGFYDVTNQIREPEQSLLLRYDSLRAGDVGLARRILFDAPSLMGYRRLKMYVHGPNNVNVDSVMFFFRIGQDSANFYEYQTLLKSGWSPANDVEIDFNEITALKEYLIRNHLDSNSNLPYDTVAGHYRVFGQPTITRVKYLVCGVINLDSIKTASGDVWVDELRVADVRRDIGTAARVSASGNIADLFTYTADYRYQDSYFRGLSSSTRGGSADNLGSGQSTRQYSFGVSVNLAKFLPRSYDASLPISMSYSKSESMPRLRFGTDIVLPEELRKGESSVSTSRSLTVSESFNKKTKNPLFSVLLNRIKTNYSYNRTESKSPAIPMSFAENYHVGSQYVLNFNTVPAIKPFIWTEGIPLLSKFKGNHFYFFPNSYSLSGDMNRTFKVWENSSRVRTRTLNRDFRGTFRVAYKISDNLNSNYNMDTKRDITDPRSVVFSFNPSKFKLGREVNYSESWGTSYTPNLFSFLSHKFNFSTSYREDINSDDRARNANASKSYGMSGVFDFNKFFAARASKQSSTPTSSPPKGKTGSADKGQSDIQRAFYSAVGVMRFLTGWIRPITYDFNEHYGYSYPRLVDRARFMFRLGLTEDIGAKTNSQSGSYGSAISTSKSTGYTLSSGTEFLGGLKTNVTFSRKISKDVIKVINPQKSVATTFPDIDFTIQPLTTFDVLNPLITRFSPRTSYTRTKSAYYNLSSGFKTSEEVSTSQRPLLAFNIDVTRGVQINISTDRSVTEKKAYNTQTGKLDSRRRDKTSGLSISTKYSFSSPTGIKIPLFGRLKFNSTMSVAVEITRQKQRSEASNGNMPFTSTGERSDFMIVPNISYSFSSQITGGLSARWQDTNDIAYKRKTHARELRCWVNIRF